MNDEIPEVKKVRGWPKGKPRPKKRPDWGSDALSETRAAAKPSMLSKMKARPNWETSDFVGPNQDVYVSRLAIPDEIVDALYRDGVALQWVTKSVRGAEMAQEMTAMSRGGWTPVYQSDFDGKLDGMFMGKGIDDVITVDDCMLVARPAAMQTKAKELERRQAKYPVQQAEKQVTEGIGNFPGARHHTALKNNFIEKTFERIEIPES